MAAETRFLFAGGGSGGHLLPGLAVAEDLRRADGHCRIEFIATHRPADRAIFGTRPSEQVTHLSVESTAALRRRPWAWLTANWKAYRRCCRLLTASRPNCLIGLGGFASVPAVIAARRLGIPIVLMEQNVLPGRATRWLARLADQVCLSDPQTREFLPHAAVTVVTGNPVPSSRGPLLTEHWMSQSVLARNA